MSAAGRISVVGLALLVGSAFAGLAYAHDKDWVVPEAARKVKNPVPATPESIQAGSDNYSKRCVACHGQSGKGDGPEADKVTPKPANFTDAHMMSEMTDGEIFYKITEGKKPMPSYKTRLTDEERWQLVNFLRTFTAKPGAAPAKGSPAH